MPRLLLLLLLLLPHLLRANVTLPALLTDNMVLQQKTTVALWGWAAPGEAVTVTAGWHPQPARATADAQGNWLVRVPTGQAGGPYTLTIEGQNKLVINNVLLGEVWLCSGQSNMNYPLAKGATKWQTGEIHADSVLPTANYPQLRLFTVAQRVADQPERDVQGQWVACTPETVRGFSAVAYYFGQEIQRRTGYPVGLIHSSWGGTPAESWTRREALEADPQLAPILTRYAEGLTRRPAYEAALAAWKQAQAASPATAGPKPAEPLSATSNKSPTKLYNGMIRGLEPYALRGVLWYQGESNAERAWQYRTLFPALIQNWRQDWQQPDLPFYFVQIAPHKGQNPEIREAQLLAYRAVPHTGLVVTTDVGDSLDIHPRNKLTVAHRLALWALHDEYGQKKLPTSGPLYRRLTVRDGRAHLHFDHDQGLRSPGGPLREFAVAGADQIFYPATAEVQGREVVVSSPQVPQPVAVRFGWRKSPMPNLVNGAGLPASPFRTDDWPTSTQGKL